MSPKPKTVLIVDDDEGMRDTIASILKREFRVLRVATGEAALAVLHKEDVDLVLLDVRLPGITGFEVLRIVKENYSLVEVIMISSINEVETAVQAMKHGAYHYVTKNFEHDQLRSIVRNASERQDLNRQVLTLSAQVADESGREFIVGPSRLTRDIVDLVQKIAQAVGNRADSRRERHRQGTARAADSPRGGRPLTRRSSRSTLPPFRKNWSRARCSATRRARSPARVRQQLGKFELASNGTLFLDEIGDLRLELQAEAAARDPGRRDRACRRTEADQDQLPPDCRDQRRSGQGGERGALPGRPLLPDQRDPHQASAVARALRGHSAARRVLPHSATTHASTSASSASPNRRWRC